MLSVAATLGMASIGTQDQWLDYYLQDLFKLHLYK